MGLMLQACEKGTGINFFTKEQDRQFGLQMKDEIASSGDFNVLDRSEYPEAYNRLDSIVNTILTQSDDFKNKEDFAWEAYIVDENVLNAFACPGGYLYFYTGLINYLENEAEFAGVVGHEMAHADLRHSTRQMTSQYGYSVLLNIVLGNDSTTIKNIVAGLAGNLGALAFSRDHEDQSDEYAVKYLSDTDWDPLQVGGFFKKLLADDQTPGVPEFLSTHPSPEHRVENIEQYWEDEGSKTGYLYEDRYQKFQNSLNK